MRLIYLSLLLAMSLTTFEGYSQTVKPRKAKKIETAEFSVKGVCGMCETRIEKAALIKGVKSVQWDQDEQLVKVMYLTKKVKLEDIQGAIANVGHDTDMVKAPDEIYSTLPACCAYRDGVKSH